ncbi:MAG: hypothetical protein U5K76_15415 [Woeseiaceae bacterium]|nr:hypothetical protein [Woeseiaceae bacterium]
MTVPARPSFIASRSPRLLKQLTPASENGPSFRRNVKRGGGSPLASSRSGAAVISTGNGSARTLSSKASMSE